MIPVVLEFPSRDLSCDRLRPDAEQYLYPENCQNKVGNSENSLNSLRMSEVGITSIYSIGTVMKQGKQGTGHFNKNAIYLGMASNRI